jgi:hypothetical protein
MQPHAWEIFLSFFTINKTTSPADEESSRHDSDAKMTRIFRGSTTVVVEGLDEGELEEIIDNRESLALWGKDITTTVNPINLEMNNQGIKTSNVDNRRSSVIASAIARDSAVDSVRDSVRDSRLDEYSITDEIDRY